MEKENSTNPSTASQVELDKATATSNQTTSAGNQSSAGVLTPQYIDPNQNLVTAAQLQNVEDRLTTKMVQNAGGKTGLLWLVAVLALAAGGFGGYTAFMEQQKLNLLDNSYRTSQAEYLAKQGHFESAIKDIDSAKLQVEAKARDLSQALDEINRLQEDHKTLSNNDQNLNAVLGSIQTAQGQITAKLQEIEQQLNTLQERNPEDWLLSESYFMVKNAFQKAVFEKDVPAAIWMLTAADELLVNIEQEQLIAVREAISRDLITLRNIQQIDFRGLGISLDRAYDNVDQLVFNGYSDKRTVFNKQTAPTENIADWKDNLLTSAQSFSKRFVEVRRRDANSVSEFLSPEQELYVRENIKTRILLAKNALSHGEKEEMQSNLEQAVALIKGYCDMEHEVTKTTIEYLEKISQSQITIETPKVLESYQAFNGFAKEHLLGRGK